MNKQMKIFKEIAQIADSNDFYTSAQKFGEVARKAFGPRHRNQLTNLENIANSTFKVTDVLDYIKNQIAKAEKNKTWRNRRFGVDLKKNIEETLRGRRGRVCQILGIQENSVDGQRIYLQLTREFVRQLVVHYEYRVTVGDEPDDNNN